MKRLNKKGFTLVELLAAIVILAVLMLVGAQAIGTIINNTKANSLKSSLDTAMEQAQMKYTSAGELVDNDPLTGYLDYKSAEYTVSANDEVDPDSGKIVYTVSLTVPSDSSFENVRCSHGDLRKFKFDHPTNNKLGHSASAKFAGYECKEDERTHLVTIIKTEMK